MSRFLARVCSEYRFRCELAQNLNNWRDWLVAVVSLLLFWWIVLAIHLAIHPIFFGWWIPIVAMWGGVCISSRYYHHDLRGPIVSFLWFVGVMALLPYLCTYHWELVLQADALGKGIRGMFTMVLLHPFLEPGGSPPINGMNFPWWAHLPPCWFVAAMASYLVWSDRNEWRFVLELPRWVPLQKNWYGYPLPNEWGFKPY